jgi:hypothetical protein
LGLSIAFLGGGIVTSIVDPNRVSSNSDVGSLS